MESKVSLAQASSDEVVLPARVQEALGQLVGSAKEGLLALSVGVGLGVLAELLEEEVVEVVGAKGKHDPERVAVRHGHESGEVTWAMISDASASAPPALRVVSATASAPRSIAAVSRSTQST